MKCADMSFGLNNQALAVAQFLSQIEPDFAEYDEDNCRYDIYRISTFPWYNGREKGVLFCLKPFVKSATLVIAVFEHRNSDSICAVKCLYKTCMLNPPERSEILPQLYNEDTSTPSNMITVPYGHVGEMAQKVYNLMRDYYHDEYVIEKESKNE